MCFRAKATSSSVRTPPFVLKRLSRHCPSLRKERDGKTWCHIDSFYPPYYYPSCLVFYGDVDFITFDLLRQTQWMVSLVQKILDFALLAVKKWSRKGSWSLNSEIMKKTISICFVCLTFSQTVKTCISSSAIFKTKKKCKEHLPCGWFVNR